MVKPKSDDSDGPPNSDVEADLALTAFGTTQLNAKPLGRLAFRPNGLPEEELGGHTGGDDSFIVAEDGACARCGVRKVASK